MGFVQLVGEYRVEICVIKGLVGFVQLVGEYRVEICVKKGFGGFCPTSR